MILKFERFSYLFGWVFLLDLGTCHYGIGSTRNYGVIIKFERFFYLSGRFFGLESPIIIDAFIESQCITGNGYLML